MGKVKSVADRFMAKVDKTETCWLWTASIAPTGYGKMHYLTGSEYAHRISYRLFKGEIPDDLTVDHICKVRNCVNPDHLRLLTQEANSSRANKGNLRPICRRGHDMNDPRNIGFGTRRTGPRAGETFRMCAECSRINARSQYEKSQSANIM